VQANINKVIRMKAASFRSTINAMAAPAEHMINTL
jgi:hypothetical protein